MLQHKIFRSGFLWQGEKLEWTKEGKCKKIESRPPSAALAEDADWVSGATRAHLLG